MKTVLFISAAVLIPFALIIALGFRLLPQAPADLPQSIAALAAKPTRSAPQEFQARQPEEPAPPEMPVEEQPEQAQETPAPPTDLENERDQILQGRVLPLLSDLNPKAQQCYDSLRPTEPQPVTVSVKLDILASGRISRARLVTSSWDEPRLTSCILNAIEATKTDPVGVDFVDQLHLFTLLPTGHGTE